MTSVRFRIGIVIAFVCALGSAQALAQDDAEGGTLDAWPTPGSSNIAPKYKATLEKPANVEWSLGAELGFLAVASHVIQLGNDGTRFDYRNDGGQDVLFPFFRLSTELSSMRAFALATTSPIESQASSTSATLAVAQSEPRATRIRRATATPRTGSTSSR